MSWSTKPVDGVGWHFYQGVHDGEALGKQATQESFQSDISRHLTALLAAVGMYSEDVMKVATEFSAQNKELLIKDIQRGKAPRIALEQYEHEWGKSRPILDRFYYEGVAAGYICEVLLQPFVNTIIGIGAIASAEYEEMAKVLGNISTAAKEYMFIHISRSIRLYRKRKKANAYVLERLMHLRKLTEVSVKN